MEDKAQALIRKWFIDNRDLLYRETIDEITLGESLHKPECNELSREIVQALTTALLNKNDKK